MEKIYDLTEEDANKVKLYTSALMELGLISVEVDENNGSSNVVLGGRYTDINHAVNALKSAGIKVKPRECSLYPVECSNAKGVWGLEHSLGSISEMNRQLLNEPYCKSSGFEGCPQYREKQAHKTNA